MGIKGAVFLVAVFLSVLIVISATAFSETVVEVELSPQAHALHGWYKEDLSFSFVWNTTNGAPPKESEIYYCVGQSNTCEPRTLYAYGNKISLVEGANYIRYTAYLEDEPITGTIPASEIVRIDKTPPTVPGFSAANGVKGLVLDTSTRTYTANYGIISFIQNASDSLSGLDYCEYNPDYLAENPSLNWQPAVKQRPLIDWNKAIYYYSTTGQKNIAIRCTDKAGNLSNIEVSPFKVNVIAPYDSTPPTTGVNYSPNSPNSKGWLKENTKIELIGTDNESGVKKIIYCIDEQNSCTPNRGYAEPINFHEGKAFIRFYSINNHELAEEVKSVEIKIDETAPSTIGFFWVSGKSTQNNVQEFTTGMAKLRVNSAREELSGIYKCLINFDYENNDQNWVINPEYPNWVQVPLPKENGFSDIFEYDYQSTGEKKIGFKCIDNAGNENVLPLQTVRVSNVFGVNYFDVTPTPARLDKNFTIDLNLSNNSTTMNVIIKLINGDLRKEYMPLKRNNSEYTLTITPDNSFSARSLGITAVITDIEGNTRYYTINKKLVDGYLVDLKLDSTQKTVGNQLFLTGRIISRTGRNLPTDKNIEIKTSFGNTTVHPDANGNFIAALNLTQTGTYALSVYLGDVLADLNNSATVTVTHPAAVTPPVSSGGVGGAPLITPIVDQNTNVLDQNAPVDINAPTDVNAPIIIDTNTNSDQNIPINTSDQNALTTVDLNTTDLNGLGSGPAQPSGLFGLFGGNQGTGLWILPILIIVLLIIVGLTWVRNQQLASKK